LIFFFLTSIIKLEKYWECHKKPEDAANSAVGIASGTANLYGMISLTIISFVALYIAMGGTDPPITIKRKKELEKYKKDVLYRLQLQSLNLIAKLFEKSGGDKDDLELRQLYTNIKILNAESKGKVELKDNKSEAQARTALTLGFLKVMGTFKEQLGDDKDDNKDDDDDDDDKDEDDEDEDDEDEDDEGEDDGDKKSQKKSRRAKKSPSKGSKRRIELKDNKSATQAREALTGGFLKVVGTFKELLQSEGDDGDDDDDDDDGDDDDDVDEGDDDDVDKKSKKKSKGAKESSSRGDKKSPSKESQLRKGDPVQKSSPTYRRR
jgi:hypothetical protein